MPAKALVVPDLSLVVGRAWDVLTADDLAAATTATRRDPRFHPHFRQLADFRAVTDYDFGGSTVRRLATVDVYAPGTRRAFVVASDESFGLARMFQMLREAPNDGLRVYRDFREAVTWLDLTGVEARVLAILGGIGPAA
ncbi:MAG: hypothetical protein KGL38_09620 [Gemmatimonadota bacterium]|nr:hypothetical protein [Gemmatimonadota bacterium]MDE3173987.1 hypothetical protein [Gemmatimonadota bacterium]MDE3217129.1 hypothetical protein [Gemmatimonadota bacterium]